MENADSKSKNSPLIIALDVTSEEEVRRLCKALVGHVAFFKIGLGLFLSIGTRAIEHVKSLGGKVFLDLKFYDIPKQVAAASREAVKMGVDMFTIHALGGHEMMRRAIEAAKEQAKASKVRRPQVLGVTILTSLDERDLVGLGVTENVGEEVLLLAARACEAGIDGVVASPAEILLLRKTFGPEFLIITPGVRIETSADRTQTDQKRVSTAIEALEKGATYVVMGRSLLSSPHPEKLVEEILRRI